MKVPLLYSNSKSIIKSKQTTLQRQSPISNERFRTSDTFKGTIDNEKQGTFSSLSTLQKRSSSLQHRPNQTTRVKFYYDEHGNKVIVRNTIEDFLKTEDDDKQINEDEDIQSTCSSTLNLRDSSLNLKQNWGNLPFYDKVD